MSLVVREAMLQLFNDDHWDEAAVELDVLLCQWQKGQRLRTADIPERLTPQFIVLGLHAIEHGKSLVDELFDLIVDSPARSSSSFCNIHAAVAKTKWQKEKKIYHPQLGERLQSRVDAAFAAWFV